jgi:hypothetical protein
MRGTMSERELQEMLRKAALLGQWHYYHVHNAKHSPSGFPDTVCVRDGRLVVAELKRTGEIPTPEQTAWLGAFRQVRQVDVYVWTPDNLDEVMEVLK